MLLPSWLQGMSIIFPYSSSRNKFSGKWMGLARHGPGKPPSRRQESRWRPVHQGNILWTYPERAASEEKRNTYYQGNDTVHCEGVIRVAQAKASKAFWMPLFLNTAHLVLPPGHPADFATYPEMCFFPPLRPSLWFRSHPLLPGFLTWLSNCTFSVGNLRSPMASISQKITANILASSQKAPKWWSLPAFSPCLLCFTPLCSSPCHNGPLVPDLVSFKIFAWSIPLLEQAVHFCPLPFPIALVQYSILQLTCTVSHSPVSSSPQSCPLSTHFRTAELLQRSWTTSSVFLRAASRKGCLWGLLAGT